MVNTVIPGLLHRLLERKYYLLYQNLLYPNWKVLWFVRTK